jgi:hypothetical protein
MPTTIGRSEGRRGTNALVGRTKKITNQTEATICGITKTGVSRCE